MEGDLFLLCVFFCLLFALSRAASVAYGFWLLFFLLLVPVASAAFGSCGFVASVAFGLCSKLQKELLYT